MESKRGNYEKALEYIQEAYSTDTRDGKIIVLYSALLRKTGDNEKAMELLDHQLAFDPIDFSAWYEKELLQGNVSMDQWLKNMQDVDNDYLEIATNYMDAGLLDGGIKLLASLDNPKNPLTYYYLSWFYSQSGDDGKAREMLKLADNVSLDYCFPYRNETETVLDNAIRLDPQNVGAYYLLGNLLYDKRSGDATAAWEKVGVINDDIPMVWRNLAFAAFYHEHNAARTIKYMTRAIDEENDIPLWYAELARYYDASDADFRECLAIFRKNIDVVKQDVAAPKALVQFYNLDGDYDEAIDLLNTHHFRTWEGGRSIYWYYVDAHTLKALQLMKNNKYDEAISNLETAMLYPENLEVGKPMDDERNAMIYYYMGMAYDKMGNHNKAQASYQKSIDAKNRRGMQDLLYFQAKANEKLGHSDKAKEMFNELIKIGQEQRKSGSNGSLIAVEESSWGNSQTISNAYYLEALGNKGLGNTIEAKKLLGAAIKAYKINLWAKIMLGY